MDALGSLRGVVNPTGEVLEGQHYTPYGTPFGQTGTAQTAFGFTGEITDPNGLLNLRARYYVPGLGVFPSLDPVEEGNRYGYVGGNVVNRVDPSGMIGERPEQWNKCQQFENPCYQMCSGVPFIHEFPGLYDACVAGCYQELGLEPPVIPMGPIRKDSIQSCAFSGDLHRNVQAILQEITSLLQTGRNTVSHVRSQGWIGTAQLALGLSIGSSLVTLWETPEWPVVRNAPCRIFLASEIGLGGGLDPAITGVGRVWSTAGLNEFTGLSVNITGDPVLASPTLNLPLFLSQHGLPTSVSFGVGLSLDGKCNTTAFIAGPGTAGSTIAGTVGYTFDLGSCSLSQGLEKLLHTG